MSSASQQTRTAPEPWKAMRLTANPASGGGPYATVR